MALHSCEREVVHVKAHKLDGLMKPISKKFDFDPERTTFEVLYTILACAFQLKSDFTISYLSQDESGCDVYLSLLGDWDFDAAVMYASEPYLTIKVDCRPFQFKKPTIEEWDIVKNDEIPEGKQDSLKNFRQAVKSGLDVTLNRLFSTPILAPVEEGQSVSVPLDDVQFRRFVNDSGRLENNRELWQYIYHNGVNPELRKVIWKLLLNVYPAHLDGNQRLAYMKRKSAEYHQLKKKWQPINWEAKKKIVSMIRKDVTRTDRSHPFYKDAPDPGTGGSFCQEENPNVTALFNVLTTYALYHPGVSYAQGMSDLASPLLLVMEDEAHTYVAFCALMARLSVNFSPSGSAMLDKFQHLARLFRHLDPEYYHYMMSLDDHAQLYFCYRWIVIEMKREFVLEDSVFMWEVMWASLPANPPLKELLLTEDGTDTLQFFSQHDNAEASSSTRRHVVTNPMNIHVTRAKNLSQSLDSPPMKAKMRPGSVIPDRKDSGKPRLLSGGPRDIRADAFSGIDHHRKLQRQKKLADDGVDVIPSAASQSTNTAEAIEDLFESSNESQLDGFSSSFEVITPSEIPLLPSPETFGLGNPFLLFLCVAILLEQRGKVMSNKLEFNEVTVLFDKLARHHDVRPVLRHARILFADYQSSRPWQLSADPRSPNTLD